MRPATQLRNLLARPGIIASLGVHDAFSARLAELAGLELAFVGGFGTSASLLGLPDVELLTLTEMASAVVRISSCVRIPVIADGDTGHGDLPNVARTVRLFERAGAAGVILEDQVSPKRCGHFQGKRIVSVDEMLFRLKTALAARVDADFVIIARTDSRAVEGMDAAIARANRYGEVGADVCFVEAPVDRNELERAAREVTRPLLANMLTGGLTPILSVQELESLGYKIAVCPIACLLATGAAIQRVARTLVQQGRVDSLAGEMMSFGEVKELLGVEEFLALRRRIDDDGAEGTGTLRV